MVLKRRKWKQIFLLQGEKMKKYIKNTKTKRQEPTQEFSIQKKTKSQSTEDEMFGNNVAEGSD